VSGKPVYQQIRHNDINRGTAIFDVTASRETVWEVITSFQDYPEWIKEMSATEIYLSEGRNILVDFTLSVYMVDVQYYIKHDYQPEKGSMTWTLDYSRKSDLDDSAGYWLVYPSPVDTAKTRVEYSVDLRIGPTIPSFIETILADKGIKNATKWVKKNAEKLGD
jgi:carbon monoxide dehydrogenase subunit G